MIAQSAFPRLAYIRRSAISISYCHAPGTVADSVEGEIQALNEMKPRPTRETFDIMIIRGFGSHSPTIQVHTPSLPELNATEMYHIHQMVLPSLGMTRREIMGATFPAWASSAVGWTHGRTGTCPRRFWPLPITYLKVKNRRFDCLAFLRALGNQPDKAPRQRPIRSRTQRVF
jgi:hypothetical protein